MKHVRIHHGSSFIINTRHHIRQSCFLSRTLRPLSYSPKHRIIGRFRPTRHRCVCMPCCMHSGAVALLNLTQRLGKERAHALVVEHRHSGVAWCVRQRGCATCSGSSSPRFRMPCPVENQTESALEDTNCCERSNSCHAPGGKKGRARARACVCVCVCVENVLQVSRPPVSNK